VRNLELVRKLGDGSAVESFLGREGAHHYLVQVSRPEMGRAADLMGRFLDTSKTVVSSTPHPDLLTPQRVTMTKDGRFMLRSDAITGWTAADVLLRGPVPEPVVIDWGMAVCEALSTLHDRGQTHGCLAPRHVHLHGSTDFPSVRLADTTFLHFRAGSSLTPDQRVTVVEPEYLSPERASGKRGTPASDVWGFGVLMVELLTGRSPFRGATAVESRMKAKHAKPPRVPERWARWTDVILGTLDPLPVNRFGSALELRQALLSLA
jgi:serine/threonine protein kinase